MNGVPFEWVLAVLISVPVLLVIGFLVLRKKGGEKQESSQPSEINMVALNPVDQNGNPVMGKLLGNVTVTETELVVEDPSVIDEETEKPKTIRIPYTDIMPLSLLDADKNIVNFWGALKIQGEYVAYTFADIAKRIRQRFDPLEADVREVGQHFIGGPPRIGGLPQLLQSTTGKIIILGAAWLVGLLMGMIIIAAHVGHF